MFCFFKNHLSPKSSLGNVKCIFESAAEKFQCQKLPNLLPTSEEVYTFKFFFKKRFTKNFSWIRRKQARQHFIKLPKVNFFLEAHCFFIKKPNSGRKQHYSSKNPLNTCKGVLKKCQKFFCQKFEFFWPKVRKLLIQNAKKFMRLIINSKKKCPWKIASWQVECSVYKQAEIFHQKCDKILLTVRKP